MNDEKQKSSGDAERCECPACRSPFVTTGRRSMDSRDTRDLGDRSNPTKSIPNRDRF